MGQEATINCNYNSEMALYLAYMPFIQGGGLFVRTTQMMPLATPVNLSVKLPNEEQLFQCAGRVVWLTPKGAQGGKPAGLGIQFLGESRHFCNKIETVLAGMLKSNQITDTI